MTNPRDESQLLRTTTLYANIRKQAHAILRGPRSIEARDLDGEPFYGWPALSLELRTAEGDRVESRIVYANPLDTTQQLAILRAVFWDGVLAKKLIADQSDEVLLATPARFVKIPAERLRKWLSDFHGLNIANRGFAVDETIDIRRLRLEWDYLTSVLEVVWESSDQSFVSLNQRWDTVWREAGQALISEPMPTNFYEHFWSIQPNIQYSYLDYQPNWHIPK